jgi:hypothetical protein
MQSRKTDVRVFALKAFTIKSRNGKFFVTPTGRKTWMGPYKSLHHATSAIARKLSREFTERSERLRAFEEHRR